MSALWFDRRLVRLYPDDFRERFGDGEMEAVFVEAWEAAQREGRRTAWVFLLRELIGLARGIPHARWRARKPPTWRILLNVRWMVLILFGVSLSASAIFSLNYWGYVTQPSTLFPALKTVERMALVQFEPDYQPVAVPVKPPLLTTPVFPPSQILPLIGERLATIPLLRTLDEPFAEQLTAALAEEGIELGARRYEYSPEPVIDANGCGETCFQPGLQPQPDGSLLQLMPKIDADGQFTGENEVMRLTPEDWWYYPFQMPAGYVVQGRGADGTPLIFAGIASGAVGNDHYLYYEFLFEPDGDGRLAIQDRQRYAFDISGLEGITFPFITIFLFVPLFIVWGLVAGAITLVMVVVLRTRRFAGRRSPAGG